MNWTTQEIWRVIFWLSLAATLYTYFIYPLLLTVVNRFRRRRTNSIAEAPTNGSLPTVTMVVSAWNEEAVLPEKIANCRNLDYPHDKLNFILGSDGSDDMTWSILQKITDERFKTFHIPVRSGKVQMLNWMLEMANSEIIVFSDANTIFRTDAVLQLVRAFRDPTVGCAIGKLDLIAGNQETRPCRPEGMYWRYENKLKKQESALGAVPTINGGIFAIRRELYQTLPPHSITEDQVLGMKIMTRGHRCVFIEDAVAYETLASWTGELRRRIRISAGNFQSLLLVPGILNPLGGRVSFAFFSHKFLRWLVPFFLMNMLLANIILAGQPFYGSTLLAQAAFYFSGLLGVLIPDIHGAARLLTIPKYFIVMNFAILIGFGKFITGRQKVTWARVNR